MSGRAKFKSDAPGPPKPAPDTAGPAMTPLRRRALLTVGAAAALGRPAIGRAASATTLRFVPVIDRIRPVGTAWQV
jgi:hypothetical protein